MVNVRRINTGQDVWCFEEDVKLVYREYEDKIKQLEIEKAILQTKLEGMIETCKTSIKQTNDALESLKISKQQFDELKRIDDELRNIVNKHLKQRIGYFGPG